MCYMKPAISVCIIAKNAAQLLPLCLEGLDRITSDVVLILDPSSTDDTALVAKKLKARVIDRTFDNFAAQKNYAAQKATGDWVLFLDADEQLSTGLIDEIKSLDFSAFSAFYIPRLNYIFGRPIYHTNWGPSDDTHIWLYDKRSFRWVGVVHEEVRGNGPVGKLQHYKLHHPYTGVSDFMAKMNLYTSLETKFTNPIVDFFRRYVWHRGFVDGWHGLFLSYLMFVYHTVTGVKLWQKKHQSG